MGAAFRKNRGYRHETLLRVLQLMRALQQRPWKLCDLGKKFHCHVRTIRRDIELLEQLHAPIVRDERGIRLAGPVPYIDAPREEVSA